MQNQLIKTPEWQENELKLVSSFSSQRKMDTITLPYFIIYNKYKELTKEFCHLVYKDLIPKIFSGKDSV